LAFGNEGCDTTNSYQGQCNRYIIYISFYAYQLVEGQVVSSIGRGLCVFVGVGSGMAKSSQFELTRRWHHQGCRGIGEEDTRVTSLQWWVKPTNVEAKCERYRRWNTLW